MSILTNYIWLFFPVVIGVLAIVSPRTLVNGAGPEADRKQRLIRILGVVIVVAVAVVIAAVLLKRK
jgi:mannitol-specific phosphotransferase system IIBC component